MTTKPRGKEARVKALQQYRDKKREKYGIDSVSLGSERYQQDVVPSPSLMLDYKMGTGGMPYRHLVEVFGANTLGKSTVMGYTTINHVQAQGKLPALIAAEPQFDLDWAGRFFDPELLLIERPDNAEEAFEMLYDLVYDDLVDYIVLDSLGALAAKSEAEGGGKKAFGISGVVTAGLNAVMPRMFKNGIGLMIINQQRQDTKSRSQPGMMSNYDSPGGEALHHHAVIRIQLKPGRTRYTVPMGEGKDREAEVLVGRELVCSFKKNKMAINSKAARFEFFHIPTDKYGFGLDLAEDLIRTGKTAGVIKGTGSWLEHGSFPKGRVNGKKGLEKALQEEPDIAQILRGHVLEVMRAEQGALRKQVEQGLVTQDTPAREPDPDANPDGKLLPNLLDEES